MCDKRILFILLLIAGFAKAQNITTLDWDELRIDSVLPVYTEVVPLETDYRQYNYSVAIEYPEWAPLTAEETRHLERIGRPISEQLQVSSSVSVSRKQGYLDIAFVPIIRQGSQYRKLVSASITILPKAKNKGLKAKGAGGASAERYTRKSVLSEGKWVKIAITEDGMYRLTRTALKKMGFTNPDNIRLYGHGGYCLSEYSNPDNEYDDLQEVPLYKADANTWLFWGNGLVYWQNNKRVFNPYATKACYFLTEGDKPATLATVTAEQTPVGEAVTTTVDHVLYEKDEFAWYHGGRNLYDGTNYANGNNHVYKLSTKYSTGGEQLTIVFTAGAETKTTLSTTVNGNALADATLGTTSQYIYATQNERTIDVSSMSSGSDWTIRLTTTSGNDAHLDYLALHYNRLLTTGNDGFIAFSQSASQPTTFRIVGSNVKVMRIGQPNMPAALVNGTQSSQVYYDATVDDGSLRYVAFDPSYAFPQPTVVGNVENQNLHALDSIDMVIIVPASGKLTSQAERLAEAHLKYDSLRVAIVPADHIYNEFSSGTPDATAYRRLMKMLYDRAQSMDVAPRYLLLFGDCAWDNRMISTGWRNYNPNDYLLCFESENSFSATQSYVMEDYFGLLDDGEGNRLLNDKVDIGVGRFPVTSANDARIVVDKTIDFLSNSNAGDWKNVISILGDDGDNNQHLEMADDIAERIKTDNPEMEVRKVMWDAYDRVTTLTSNTYPKVKKIIKDQMKEGALVMNYTGHASTYAMSHEYVLLLQDFVDFKSPHLPLWITAACDVMPFDGQIENIGETAILNEGGAAVAFYGTARTVYAHENLSMNRWFMHYLLACDASGRRYRVGDAIRLAKNYLINNNIEISHRENKLQYALLGDPALTFGAPVNRVVLDSINGISLKDNATTLQLRAGESVRMSGHLVDADGQLLNGFTGSLSSRVYDNLETIVCKNNDNASKGAFQFENREKVLFVGQDSVRNGKFTISFVMPVDINYSDQSGRVVFYAIDENNTTEANGYSEAFLVGGVSPTISDDTQGPTIFAYLNTENFQDGDYVNSTPFFVAHLEDASGLCYSGSGLGHDMLLTVDGDVSQTYIVNDYYTPEFGDYTHGTVGYNIPALSEGHHTLQFRAWDVLNNSSSTQLNFVVDPAMRPSMMHVASSQNPAITSTKFLITYNMPGTDCDVLIEVFDFAGRRMWSRSLTAGSTSGTIVVPWNLTMQGGGRLCSGIYFYRVVMSQGNSKKTSKTQKIVIHGNN